MTIRGEDFLELRDGVLVPRDPDYLARIDPSTALEHSIAKWEMIVRIYEGGHSEYICNGSGDTCALCYHYDSCVNCPIPNKNIRFNGCVGMPYTKYVLCFDDPAPEALAAAREELAFLQSLREEAQP